MSTSLVLEPGTVMVTREDGFFTLEIDAGTQTIFVPLTAEGADNLRSDLDATVDTLDQAIAIGDQDYIRHLNERRMIRI